MDYVRVGGVCLLLVVLAAALPINALAQTPQTATGTGSGSSENAAGGTSSTISQSMLSQSSGQGETISAEKLMKRNSGLKPLTKSSSSAKSVAAASETTPAASASVSQPAETSKAAASSTETTTSTPATDTSTTDAAKTESTTTAQTTADEKPQESQTITTGQETSTQTSTVDIAPASETSKTSETASNAVTTTASEAAASSSSNETAVTATDVTPPENVTLGSVVSSNATNESENAVETTEESSNEEPSSPASEETAPSTDRIWREGISPLEYTWTPQSFAGFFYDLKNDVGTEKLTVKLRNGGKSIGAGDLTYSTTAQDTDFEYSNWGSYQVIGFMAEKYFAGYKSNEIFDKDRSLINDGQLRQVLIDTDDESTITTGSVLPLEEGYELRIKQIDINGNKVYLSLAKDGEEVDSKVISPENLKSATYQYKVEISGEDTPIVLAHISNVFTSTESALVTIDGLFQISDTYASVEDGDKYEKMKVTSVSDVGVEMDNEDSFSLRKGSTTKIFGEVGFQVADSDTLRFAPVVDRSGPQDVRGTVINPSNTSDFTWTPYNFEGFYYDIDDDVGTESLEAKITGGSKIEEKDLIYKTSPQPVKFQYEFLCKYDVIGFMADKYFAGYNNATGFTDEASPINEGQLRKVLLDSDDSETIASGSVLSLQEGYELRIKQVDLNGNKVYLSLAKDGDEVDSKVVTPSSDPEDRASNYMYKVDMSGEKDVPIIVAHIQSVFKSTEADLATVDGLFQVSDSPESVEEGEIHGKMKVETLGTDGITMRNDGTISLSRDKTVEIMDNLKFQVADSSKRLTAPIAHKAGLGKDMNLNVPAAVVDNPIEISVKSGVEAISGAQIYLNGSSIGPTDATGLFTYTPTKIGTYPMTAKKSGYNDAKADLVVRTAEEASALAASQEANATLANKLSINAPSEVAKGETFVITVLEGINQTPVDGAGISLDDQSIGETSAQGTLTYSANETGKHILKAEKQGFDSTTKDLSVVSSLKVVGLTAPDKASVGQEIKITAAVQNTGKASDTRMLDLLVNDTVVDSKNVTAKAEENATASFSYKPKDPGQTKFSIDEQSKIVDVGKAQNSNWLIALIIVLLIAIGGGYYLYTTGELETLRKRLQGR
ncbi:S-layer protein [uncultured archaeon]|nr:S-layer protein [uncultured archaeon]